MDRVELGRRIYDTAHLTGRFVLRSGGTSDEYFDKYLLEADPVLLRAIAEAMAQLVPPAVDALAGLELGGVPLATELSQLTGLATRFVRKEAKAYGTCRLAEGGDVDGLRLVVVEDVVTSGGQVVMSCADLRERGAEIVRVLCVIDREAGGAAALQAEGLDLRALFTMTELAPTQPTATQPTSPSSR
jgi:orotate phosphoribosyltransferase